MIQDIIKAFVEEFPNIHDVVCWDGSYGKQCAEQDYKEDCPCKKRVISFLQENLPKLVEEAKNQFHSHYSGKVEHHDVPCQDCGSQEWIDWLLPHPVFNAVCPGGDGYLCIPCFGDRMRSQLKEQITKEV